MSSPVKTLVAAPASLRSGRARGIFSVTAGPEVGRVLSLEPQGSVTLGRAPSCTYRFDDASVSGEHAMVIGLDGRYLFKDEGSTNGSFLNDVPCKQPTPLSEGDRVQLGTSTLLRFSIVDEQEERAMKQVFEAALRDALTGALNRGALEERLEAELGHANRHSHDLSVVIFDLDHFKRVNDTFGHLGGDAVLRSAAELVRSVLRADDVLGRYGGEEFLIVARGTDLQHAATMAERLRETLVRSPVAFEGQEIHVTASGGVASLACCGDRRDRTTLLAIADGRLYRAKEAGRNRIVAS